MQNDTRRDANVTICGVCAHPQMHTYTQSLLCTYALQLCWLISEANNTIPHVVRSIIVSQGLHYKALDSGLDGPLRKRSGVCQNCGRRAKLHSQTAGMKGGLVLDLSLSFSS